MAKPVQADRHVMFEIPHVRSEPEEVNPVERDNSDTSSPNESDSDTIVFSVNESPLSKHLKLALQKATNIESNYTLLEAKLSQKHALLTSCLNEINLLKTECKEQEEALALAQMQILFLQSNADYFEHALHKANNLIGWLNKVFKVRPR